MIRSLPLSILLALAACGSGTQSEKAADQLEKAAGQSDPTSAAALENAADKIRETGDGNLADPNATAQQALEKAAAVDPTGVGSNVTVTTKTSPPPPKQAIPNRDGQRQNFDENGQLQARPTAVPPNARD